MRKRYVPVALFLAVLAANPTDAASQDVRPPAAMPAPAERDDVNDEIGDWPAGPQLAAQEMMAKYGAPQEVTSERLIWHNAGPFARIMVTRKELPHNFPLTHKDYLEHTIYYDVPADKTDQVHAFDASITIHPGSGELSARCDLESNNVLTLNLANDIVKNGKTVAAARKEFGEAVTARTVGNPPPSTQALQFRPATPGAAAELETVTIPGSPRPANAARLSADADVMAQLIALDENEVHAAMAAQEKKDIGAAVLEYAKMLHREHGRNVVNTQQLGMRINVTPVESSATENLHAKGAEALAKLVPEQGNEFAREFLDQMVKGHREALQMIDQWTSRATNAALKQHLATSRQHVAKHLEQAEALRKDIN